jgi:G:T/U-mismatch repair DNA glycosylase
VYFVPGFVYFVLLNSIGTQSVLRNTKNTRINFLEVAMQIQNKPQIISALAEKVDAFNNCIAAMNKEEFEATPNGKWSAGQNLDHLIRSIKPLQLAYGLPKIALTILFGKTNRPSRTYDELVTKYKTKLAAGGKASGPFIPPAIRFEKKDELIKRYAEQKQKLIKKIEKQSEADLDKYILPHPLLGKVTLREMLYFTIHHNEHHLELLKGRLA